MCRRKESRGNIPPEMQGGSLFDLGHIDVSQCLEQSPTLSHREEDTKRSTQREVTSHLCQLLWQWKCAHRAAGTPRVSQEHPVAWWHSKLTEPGFVQAYTLGAVCPTRVMQWCSSWNAISSGLCMWLTRFGVCNLRQSKCVGTYDIYMLNTQGGAFSIIWGSPWKEQRCHGS